MVLRRKKSSPALHNGLATSPTASSSAVSAANSVDNEKGLTQFSLRLSKPPITCDAVQDAAWRQWHGTLQKVITKLTLEPDSVGPTWLWLESGQASVQLSAAANSASEHEGWDRTVVNCGRLPKYWLAQQLVQEDDSWAGLPKFTGELCDLIDAAGGTALRRIWHVFTLTTAGTPVPVKTRQSKQLCSEVFASACSRTGAIKWLSGGGPYTIQWVGELAKTVTSLELTCKPIDVRITKEFSFKDPWCFMRCQAIGSGAARCLLKDFFGPDEGPNALCVDKKGTQIAACVSQRAAENDLQKHNIRDDEDFVGTGRNEKRRAALSTAQKVSADKQKRRRMLKATPSQTT